jgi:hypothetical protein
LDGYGEKMHCRIIVDADELFQAVFDHGVQGRVVETSWIVNEGA